MNKLLHLGLVKLLAAGLVLGSFRGYVALFDNEAANPRRIYPYSVGSLPQADRAALEAGIPVANDEELCRLLEDYLS